MKGVEAGSLQGPEVRSLLPRRGPLDGNPGIIATAVQVRPQDPKTRTRYTVLRNGPSKQDYEVYTSTSCGKMNKDAMQRSGL